MTINAFEPRRLREGTARSGSVGGRLARQLRILSVYAPIPQLRRYPYSARRARSFLMVARVAVMTAILLIVVGGASATAAYIIRRIHAPAPVAPKQVISLAVPEKQQKPRGHAGRLLAEPAAESQADLAVDPIPAEREETPLPPSVPQTLRPARPAYQVAAWPVVEPPVHVDGIAEEAALLRQALAAIRQSKDPRRALNLLDAYDTRFPHGTLAREGSAARAQVLLLAGDNSAALAMLDRLPLDQGGYAGELRVIRGELRSLAGRCKEALVDFEAVLRQTAGIRPEHRARALYGRASCRARTGDQDGAEQDRERYLKDFPHGPAVQQLTSPP